MSDPESPNPRDLAIESRVHSDGLTVAQRFAIRDVRQMEARWNALVDRIKAIDAADRRQIAIAVTEAEGAFMRLARAIARPVRFVEDPGGGPSAPASGFAYVAGIFTMAEIAPDLTVGQIQGDDNLADDEAENRSSAPPLDPAEAEAAIAAWAGPMPETTR